MAALFKYRKSFKPIAPSLSLALMAVDRPQEFRVFEEAVLATSESEIEQLGKELFQQEVTRDNLIKTCQRHATTFASLLSAVEKAMEWNSLLTKVLLSLTSTFKSLTLEDDLPDKVEVELGSTLELVFSVRGNPQPLFEWYFAPEDGGDFSLINDLETDDVLMIEDFGLEDCGLYCCNAKHCLLVADEQGPLVVESKQVVVTVKPGSVWINKDLPKDITVAVAEPLVLKIGVISKDKLTFAWYHNDFLLPQETSDTLTIAAAIVSRSGSYHCVVSSSTNQVVSNKVVVKVDTTIPSNSNHYPFENEAIEIQEQPGVSLDRTKAAIGDKIEMRCLAACKYKIKYTWIKQGISKDLTANPNEKKPVTGVIMLESGDQILKDIIPQVSPRVSFWIYQCIISCPKTNERVYSKPVEVPVSIKQSGSLALPTFKVALIISQETYEDKDAFSTLHASRSDGINLAGKLREMNFWVISFVNLTVSEMRHALALFCSLIDESTFALFYFNGHALNCKDGLVMAGTDSNVSEKCDKLIKDRFVLLTEVEAAIDARNPLLATYIYDSCRRNAEDLIQIPDDAFKGLNLSKTFQSSYLRSYATRENMLSYEFNSEKCSQGLYMKHLLRHLDSQNSVEKVFQSVTCSFTEGEDQSVIKDMIPELSLSISQDFCLNCALRDDKGGAQSKLFFNIFSFEALSGIPSSGFDGRWSEKTFGVRRSQGSFQFDNRVYTGIIKLFVVPGHFDNEAFLHVQFQWNRPTVSESPFKFQIIGKNVSLEMSQDEWNVDGHSIRASYLPCSASKTSFTSADGPIFTVGQQDGRVDEICTLKNLQKVADDGVILAIVLMSAEKQVTGTAVLSLPITQNFNQLVLNNLVYRF